MYRILFYLSLILCFNSCGDASETCSTAYDPKAVSTNPNGDSELALLMREMFKDSWKARQAVLKNKDAKLDLETLKRIHEAQATEPEKVASPVFAAMTDTYLASVKALNMAPDDSTRTRAYSLMVSQCEVCHTQFCPGPLVKIKKLKL